MKTDPGPRLKKHAGRPDLVGEHPLGDTLQVVFILVFLGVWITDSFIWHYSTFLSKHVPFYLRLIASVAIAGVAWWFTRQGLKTVFGTVREQPEVFRKGAFAVVRHPIYLGAIMFVISLVLLTFSLASAGLLLGMTGFYIFLCRYEEKALMAFFGNDYQEYRKAVPMLFPFFRATAKSRQ